MINRRGRVDFRAVGELDFAATFKTLAELGYVPMGFSPDLPSEEELAMFREIAIKQRNGNLYGLGKKEV